MNTENYLKVKKLIKNADAIVIGAGAGLSTSAGYVYAGERFEKYFEDFEYKYKFNDMYSGGFYPYQTLEEYWAYWSRYIYVNRYMKIPKSTYEDLYEIVKDKNYFVITTNVDHCFQRAGFDKNKMFYTQGDYGLFQCSKPCHNKTYDNEDVIRKMIESQGFRISDDGDLIATENVKMEIDTDLIPKCPVCGEPMTMNLRSDDTFVEDEYWDIHSKLYAAFLRKNKNKNILFLEFGVGFNTPSIIRYPFENMTYHFENANLVRVNKGFEHISNELGNKAIGFDEDINKFLKEVK